MITEDYVSLETAKLLKEKGFDGDCRAYYYSAGSFSYEKYPVESGGAEMHNAILAPTLQMTMKWLREVHYCHIVVNYTFKGDAELTNDYALYIYEVENAKTFVHRITNGFFNTYEEACEDAIKYCLEILI